MADHVICPIPKVDNRVEDYSNFIDHEGKNLSNAALVYASLWVTESIEGMIIVTRGDRLVERYCICRTFGTVAEQVAYHNPPPRSPTDDDTESEHSTDSGSDMSGLEPFLDRSGSETYYDSDS